MNCPIWLSFLLVLSVAIGSASGAAEAGAARVSEPAPVATTQPDAEVRSALRAGRYEEAARLLITASPGRPELTASIADLARSVLAQTEAADKERSRQLAESLLHIKALHEAHLDLAALRHLREAWSITADTNAFSKESLIQDVLHDAAAKADASVSAHAWIEYALACLDLAVVDPGRPRWAEESGQASRRARAIAFYAPSEMALARQAMAKEAREVARILGTDTGPLPGGFSDVGANSNWRTACAGVTEQMLYEGLQLVYANYSRQVNLRQPVLAGLRAVRLVASTQGVQERLTGLSDATKREAFYVMLDRQIASIGQDTGEMTAKQARAAMAAMVMANMRTVQLPEDVILAEFADGICSVLDPRTTFIWPEEFAEWRSPTTSAAAIGIQVRCDLSGNTCVEDAILAGPAYRAQIRRDDVIVSVDGQLTQGLSPRETTRLLCGPAGSKLELLIRHPDLSTQLYTLTRELLISDEVKGWQLRANGQWEYFIDADQKIAYIRISRLNKNSSAQLANVITGIGLRSVRGVILDIRSNTGGVLPSARDVIQKFVDKGDLYSTRPRRPDAPFPAETVRATLGNALKVPMVVLVNAQTTSGAELIAASLQDHKRAIIIGERTAGSGGVQMLYPLDGSKAVLKITTSHLYSPGGRCIDRDVAGADCGVKPDVLVKITPQQFRNALAARQFADQPPDGNDPALAKEPADPAPSRAAAVVKAKDLQWSVALFMLQLQLNGY